MKVVTFGEILLRLAPPGHLTIGQAQSFDRIFGGSEANVAIALSQYGCDVNFVSKVPEHTLGKAAMQYLNGFGVHTNYVQYDQARLGIYYLENGYSIRPSRVIYDREQSSFSRSTINDYDFDAILKEANWFHLSGITPALSEELFEISMKALEKAKTYGVTTSCDLNYRKSLWPFELARKKMSLLMQHVDVCFGFEPLELPLNDHEDYKDRLTRPFSEKEIEIISTKLKERYNFTHIISTFRKEKSVNENTVSAMVLSNQGFYRSNPINVEIIDRVGAGDAFAAGMIYGLSHFDSMQQTIDFATTAFALKHTVEGDANILDLANIDHVLKAENALSIMR